MPRPRHAPLGFGLCLRFALICLACCGTQVLLAAEPVSLFDGKTFTGWEGDTARTFRIEDGAILGGSLETTVPRNEFLCTTKTYDNFELKLQYKLVGTEGFINGGVQIRSKRIPDHHEVIGYQADLGAGFDGALYDESRRKKMLAQPSKELLEKVLKKDDWNDYRIRCEGKRIRLWLNGELTVDYTEEDPAIEQSGLIGLQIHGGCKAIVRYRKITLEELPAPAPAAPAAEAKPKDNAAKESLFDGKTLAGWTSHALASWRVTDGAITAGSPETAQPRMEYLATVKEFENFDLTFRFKTAGTFYLSTGMYFRSRVVGPGNIVGYQADIGDGYDGGIFESGRGRGVLAIPRPEVRAGAVKQGEWNDYRLRVEGRRFRTWINGKPMLDYRERDRTTARRGVFAIELSPTMKGTIQFKDLVVEELAALPDDGQEDLTELPVGRLTPRLKPVPKLTPFPDGRFTLEENQVLVFTGPENVVGEQRSGWLESSLARTFAEAKPRFRHMGYEGDTVFRQNRQMNWGSWKENLDGVEADVVVTWFGQMEVFDTTKGPAEFKAAYADLLERFGQRTPRIVVLSPTPFERPADSHIPDNTPRNARVKEYADIARELARERGAIYVDLFSPLAARPDDAPRLTRDGLHFTDAGLREVARIVATQLTSGTQTEAPADLRAAIVEKNRIWFDNWRCMNWAFAYGDRTTQPFATGQPPFVEELTQYRPLVAHADATVQAIAAGLPVPPALPKPPVRPNPPAVSPEEERSRFVVRDGFEVNLFADERLDIRRPVQIRWDEHGRLWVLCVPSYPQLFPGERANDFLMMVEDTDGDGRADKSTRIAEGLMMPMGFEFGDGGIYVCESTQLVHLTDTDGDGKMDARRIVLSGFGTGDSHQNVNSIRWQPDGCLWFSQGYHIWSYVETPHGLAELNRSGLWRLNPRTMRLDSFLNESTAGLNCWGVTFDDYGQVFHASGADFSVWHVTPATIPTLHPLSLGPGLARSRGKSMEPEFLGSSHLAPDMQGVLLKSTYFTNQVQLYRLSDEGSSFKSEDLGDLLSSTGTEFRPLETRVGPDGAIYICDWLNPVIGHYQASYRDPRRDLSHGRIWRMTAKGRPLTERPRLETMTATQLADQLDSPERWVRNQARYTLYRKPKGEAIAAVDAVLEHEAGISPESCRRLYEISGVFAAHEEPRPELVSKLLASTDFRWRAWGTRLVGYWQHALPAPLELLTKSAADEHPRVRLEAVVAASYVPSPESVTVATLVMQKPMDFSLDYALTQSIFALEPQWRPALQEGKLDFGPRVAALVRVLTTAGGANVVESTRQLLESQTVQGTARDGLLAVLVDSGSKDDVAYAIAQANGSPLVFDAVAHMAQRRRLSESDELVRSLLESPREAARIAGSRVVEAWKLPAFLSQVRASAFNNKLTPAERGASVAAIAAVRGADAVEELLPLTEGTPVELRNAAFRTLAPLAAQPIAQRIAPLLAQAKSPEEVAALLAPLVETKAGPTALAAALEVQEPPAEAARMALQWMGEAGFDDRALLAVLSKAAGVTALRWDYAEPLVTRLVADAQTKGDAERGRLIFRSNQATCLKCHRVGDEGGKLGPDLTAVGRAVTRETITESVFWPKRQVKEGFLLTTVLTVQGKAISGYRDKETETTLTIRDATTNELRTIAKPDIEERQDAGTIMPEGITDPLDRQQRLDLLRYLFELGR